MRFKPLLPPSSAAVFLACAAVFLSGCLRGTRAGKDAAASPGVSPRAAALPQLDLKATVTVLDAETGRPIPDAWVLVAAHITVDRPAPSGDVDAIAGARSITGRDGTASVNEVQGAYYPGQSKNDAWIAMEEARARRLGPRKITGIEGGDLVVASPIYGFIHQPFAVEDDSAFQDWLKKGGKKEEYGGWIRKDAVRVNLPPVFVESKDLRKGLALTIRMRKPRDLDEWANTISLGAFVDATWPAMSVDAGATEEDQQRLYWLFGRTLDQIGLGSGKIEHVRSFAVYLRDEAIKYYVGHRFNPEDQDGAIQLWLAEKALEVLPPDSAEVKDYIGPILKGVADEGEAPRWQNHFQDPTDPSRGLPGADSALQWAGLDADNPRNEWDWQDARRYYAAGDRAKAYEALGHVLRLLVNLAIPKYTQMQEAKETEFESALEALMKEQAGQLPPDYWWSTKEPAFAKTPRARFEAVAGRTAALGLEAGIGATNEHGESPAPAAARKSFPAAIGQAAGLLRDFYRLMHRPRFAGPPGDGDGGTGTAVQASSGAASYKEPHPAANAQARETATDAGARQSQDAGKGSPKPAPAVPDVLKKDHPDNPKDIDDLVAIVRAGKKETQERAAMKLADPDPKAMAALKDKYLALLDDVEIPVKSLAIAGCAKLDIKESIPKIRAALRSTPKNVFLGAVRHPLSSGEQYGLAMSAAHALGHFKDIESVLDVLERDILSPSWGLVLPAFGPKALPVIVQKYRDADARMKIPHLRAIQEFHNPENIPQLEELMKDPDPRIRTSASTALGQIAALGKKEDAGTARAAKTMQDNYDNLDDTGKDRYFMYCGHAHCDIDKNIARARKFLVDHNYTLGGDRFMISGLCETGDTKVIPFMKELLHGPDPYSHLHPQAACCLLHLTGKLPDFDQNPGTTLELSDCQYLSKEQKAEIDSKVRMDTERAEEEMRSHGNRTNMPK